MARFTIQDPKTGKAVTIEGDTVPSLADREQIFKDAGLRNSTPATTQKPTNGAPNTLLGNIFHNLTWGGDNVAKDAGAGAGLNLTGDIPLLDKIPFVPPAWYKGQHMQESQDNMQGMTGKLYDKAMKTKNPDEKARLLAIAGGNNDQIQQNTDMVKNSFSPDVNENPIIRGAKAGVGVATTAESLANLPSLIKGGYNVLKGGAKVVGGGGGSVLHPLKTLGNLRSTLLGGTAAPTADLESGVASNLANNDFFQAATPQAQAAAKSRLSEFLNTLNPMATSGEGATLSMAKPEATSLADTYSKLTPFEIMGKAYGRGGDLPSTALSQGTNLASRAVRQYLSDSAPKSVSLINNLMRAGYFGGRNWKTLAGTAGLGTGAFEALSLLSKLTGGRNQ